MRRKPPLIRAVIFDLGNVLVNYDLRRSAQRLSEACGVPLVRLWRHFLLSPHEKAYTRGEITCRQFFEEARRALDLSISFRTFRHYWTDIFWENEGMEELLQTLKKNYPLYLISNTNRMHFEHIKRHYPVLRHFRRLFASHEVGARKPESRIYETVLKKIRLKAEETVFIDDNPDFVRGARRLGMHALRFRGREPLIRDLEKLGVLDVERGTPAGHPAAEKKS